KRRTRIIRTTNRTHQAAPGIGVVCSTSGSDSRDGVLSVGGALHGLRSAGQRGARAVGEARLLGRPWGGRIRSACGSHVWALSRGGASAAWRWRRPGTAAAAGCFTACAIIRSRVSATRIVGARLDR
ncbi:MAG: hypothetical protein V2A73_18420, partial [Pseudomonadota bacterium]